MNGGKTLGAESLLTRAADEEARGDFEAAYVSCEQALARGGQNAVASERAARLALRLRRGRLAAFHLRAVLATAPKRADLRTSLVMVLLEFDTSSAYAEAETLAALKPRDWRAANLLGLALKRSGRLVESIPHFQKATQLDKSAKGSWINLGNVYRELRRYREAVQAYRKALQRDQRDAETTRRLGAALFECGKTDEAMTMLARAAQLQPGNAEVFHDRAVAMSRLGRFEEALGEIGKALGIRPGQLAYLRARGMLERASGRVEAATRTFRQIIDIFPDDVATSRLYADHANRFLGDTRAAVDALQGLLRKNPGDVLVATQLCRTLVDARYDEEGVLIDQAHAIAAPLLDAGPPPPECLPDLLTVALRTAEFDLAEQLRPPRPLMEQWARNGDIYPFHVQFSRVRTLEDRRALIGCHRQWGQAISKHRASVVTQPVRALKGRKLRVGILSSDLRRHPVGSFAMPLISGYDHSAVELYCYSFYPGTSDPMQKLFAERVDGFRLIPQATDREALERITADQLDILIEAGGPTNYNRLELMAHRPAPVQASWLGYPHSSGIEAIDYMLVDPYLLPDDSTLLIERPLTLAHSWVCLDPRAYSENIEIELGIPEERAGHITFGTANNPYKYSPELIALWANVMGQVPDSHFLFLRPEGGSTVFRKNMARAFARHGIAANRIEFEAVRAQHIRHYNRIDIALDTAPHTGGTTTCESLWMGVPTVTVVGPAFFERLSYTNLSNAGLGDLCATTREEYVEIAVRLAGDRARRHALRRGLRAMIRSRPLGQVDEWVENFFKVVHEAVVRRTQ